MSRDAKVTVMSDRLEQIEAQERQVTKGPWRSGITGIFVEDGDYLIRREVDPLASLNLSQADRFFIAESRQDVPWLVAQVRERDVEIARLRTEVDRAFRVGVEAMRARALREVRACDERDDCSGCEGCYGMTLEVRVRNAVLEANPPTAKANPMSRFAGLRTNPAANYAPCTSKESPDA